LNLSGSGVVIVASGAGTLTLGVGAATATLNLGASGTAGTLNAASVTGDAAEGATATVNFDQNGAYTFSPQLTGQLSVNQSGTGTTILAGNSSYTGPTTVSAGSLIVNGSLSGGSALSVNGGTLSGTGSVGAVTVNSGGTLAANTPNFTTGALSLTAAGTFALTINTSMATAGKVTASSLTLDAGNSAVLTISDSGIATALARGTKFAFLDYTPGSGPTALFSYTGIINGVETTAALNQGAQITLGDNIYSFSYDGTDGLDSALTLTVIPEPATWAMLLGGLGMLAGFQRSRRRRKF
jgi:autotransporter-associated beta strand protein